MDGPRLLYGAKAIAKYVFGEDGPRHEQQARTMIRSGKIPSFKVGAKVCARASEIDAAIERMGSGDAG